LKVSSILSEEGVLYETNCRSIIPPFELDIYISSKSLAIEINGNYWHSEAAGKNSGYHLYKTLGCLSSGVKLIHIFESEVIKSFPIIRSVVKSLIGAGKRLVNSESCKVSEISESLAERFLKKYCLNPNVRGSLNLGIFCRDKILSVMVIENVSDGSYNLLAHVGNFSFNVEGGLQKFLKFFEEKYSPESLAVQVNRRWDDGSEYQKLGFSLIRISTPNCYHLSKSHPLKLSKEPSDDTHNKIWDCGDLTFQKKYGH